MNHFWLEKHIKQWHETIAADRKPQAVIISGVAGIGKAELLDSIIADLLCREASAACGNCQNCRLNAQGYHPDVDRLVPEKELIKVKMIRELTDFFVSTPHCSDHKLAVITDAHLMNAAAANALLKVLEEPPSKGLLFLITDSKHKLMPTIRSRCITLDTVLTQTEKQQLPAWINKQGNYDKDAVMHALLLADWQPLTAQKLLDNDGVESFNNFLDLIYQALTAEKSISESAKHMVATDEIEIWYFVNQYLNQLAKSVLHPKLTHGIINHPLNQLVKKKPKVLNLIMEFADKINQIMLNFNTQIKKQLLIESLLIELKNESRV